MAFNDPEIQKAGPICLKDAEENPDDIHIRYKNHYGRPFNDLFDDEKQETDTLARMEKFGGSFVRSIPQLYIHGDPTNKAKLRHAFKGYFVTYRDWEKGKDDKKS